MDHCGVCGGQEFYLEDGFYYCEECQTRQEGKREEVVELRDDPTTRVKSFKVRKRKLGTDEEITGWTSWEKFNYILIGLTHELIELGADPKIKLTVLQLWAKYLAKLEVAFTSINYKLVPRLGKVYDKRDAAIIYGKLAVAKKKKKKPKKTPSQASSAVSSVSFASSGNSDRGSKIRYGVQKRRLAAAEYEKYMASQANSDAQSSQISLSSYASSASATGSTQSKIRIKFTKAAKEEKKRLKLLVKKKKISWTKRKEYENTHISFSYMSTESITPMKLLSLLYLALRVNNDQRIFLSDIIRYIREGHLSFYRLENLLPKDVTLTPTELDRLAKQAAALTYQGLRITVTALAKYLEVWRICPANMLTLIERYCTELQLPQGIAIYAERMLAESPPTLLFSPAIKQVPRYESRAMAYIIVVLKILFGLDGVTEQKISEVVDRINTVAQSKGLLETKLFSFCEWQRYIECRRTVIANEHLITNLRFNQNSTKNSHLYVDFIQRLDAKQPSDEPPPTHKATRIPTQLSNLMTQGIVRLTKDMPSNKLVEVFPASLTPLHSYLQQLMENSEKDIPSILREDFTATKVGYMTQPKSLQELTRECDIECNIVNASAHFADKIVRPYVPDGSEFNLVGQIKDHNEPTTIVKTQRTRRDDPEEYLHRRYPGVIDIDAKKHRIFRKFSSLRKNFYADFDFDFDQTFPSGRLKVGNYFDDDDSDDDLALSNFEQQTMHSKVENPWEKRKRPATPEKHVRQENTSDLPAASQAVHTIESEDDSEDSNPSMTEDNEELTLFRPFGEFWIYRCWAYKHVHGPSFKRLFWSLPTNYRWLLKECAYILEMGLDELYEDVMRVETYNADILHAVSDPIGDQKYKTSNRNKRHYLRNFVKKKWNI